MLINNKLKSSGSASNVSAATLEVCAAVLGSTYAVLTLRSALKMLLTRVLLHEASWRVKSRSPPSYGVLR